MLVRDLLIDVDHISPVLAPYEQRGHTETAKRVWNCRNQIALIELHNQESYPLL